MILLKAKQIATHVGDPPNKPIIRDKIKLISFQRVRPKSEQLGVKRLWHLVMFSRNEEMPISKCVITSRRIG
jgi:hypothetical protein